jgi:hypothetical protein
VRVLSPTTLHLPPVSRERATPEAIDAAGALIDALSDDAVSSQSFDGPEVAYAAAALQSQVLGTDPPDRGLFNFTREYLARRTIEKPISTNVKEAFIWKVRTWWAITI